MARIRFPTTQRELTDDDGSRETLQLTHLVTAGDLGRMFSILEGPAPTDEAGEPALNRPSSG
ncbi:MAG TPA: hypothetical protein RMF84_00035 [Polyangiaceae bacterium LLY-WYZ-14_1]|nr:hypothetical protein [Polyangiaceae bacterium LLY-WYZ-14_1]